MSLNMYVCMHISHNLLLGTTRIRIKLSKIKVKLKQRETRTEHIEYRYRITYYSIYFSYVLLMNGAIFLLYQRFCRFKGLYIQRSGLLSNSKALIIIFIFFNPKI